MIVCHSGDPSSNSGFISPCKHRFYQVIEFFDNIACLKARNYHATVYQQYLSTLKAHKFFDALDYAYLETLERGRQQRREMDEEDIYYRMTQFAESEDVQPIGY